MPFLNRLSKLISPVGSILQPDIGNDLPSQGGIMGNMPRSNPLGALADSADATGSDQQSPLAQLAGQQNQTPILDQYSQLLKNFPQYQEPSRGRKILGALAGLGAGSSPVGIADGQVVGFKYDPKSAAMAKEDVEQGPYNRKLERWGMQAKALGEGAGIEERKVSNQRLAQTEQERIRHDIAAEKDKETLREIEKQNADTRTQNAKINQYKVDHPKSVIQSVPGGNLVAIDPITKEVTDLGIDSGKLSEDTKMSIQLHNQLAEIEARTAGQKQVEGMREGSAQKIEGMREGAQQRNIESRGEQQRQTQAEKPITAGIPTETDTERVTTPATPEVPASSGFLGLGAHPGTPAVPAKTVTKVTKKPLEAAAKPKQMTDPQGNVYDTSVWSDKDIEEAKKRGFK